MDEQMRNTDGVMKEIDWGQWFTSASHIPVIAYFSSFVKSTGSGIFYIHMPIMTCKHVQSLWSSSERFCASIHSCHMTLKTEDLNICLCMYFYWILTKVTVLSIQKVIPLTLQDKPTHNRFTDILRMILSLLSQTLRNVNLTFLHMISFSPKPYFW